VATRKPPATPAAFRKAVEAGVRKSNPGAEIALSWQWSRRVTFPTGLKGFSGVLLVQAPGYAAKEMLATLAGGSLVVR
jgi:hypothetical protein